MIMGFGLPTFLILIIIFGSLILFKLNRKSTLILTEREDLSLRTTENLLNVLKKYREMTALEIAVILAELKLREEKNDDRLA